MLIRGGIAWLDDTPICPVFRAKPAISFRNAIGETLLSPSPIRVRLHEARFSMLLKIVFHRNHPPPPKPTATNKSQPQLFGAFLIGEHTIPNRNVHVRLSPSYNYTFLDRVWYKRLGTTLVCLACLRCPTPWCQEKKKKAMSHDWNGGFINRIAPQS